MASLWIRCRAVPIQTFPRILLRSRILYKPPPTPMLTALAIFAGTYLVMALGRLPGFRVDRPGAALIGAALTRAAKLITIEEAWAAINYDTVILLFGMMIVVANLRLSGGFTVVSAWVVRHEIGRAS